MKKAILLVLIALILAPAAASAKEDLPQVHIKITTQKRVSRACERAANAAPDLTGCYWFTDSNVHTIYIAETLNDKDFISGSTTTLRDWIWWHEYGHYLMWRLDMSLWNGDKEAAADEFSWYMNGWAWFYEYWYPARATFFEGVIADAPDMQEDFERFNKEWQEKVAPLTNQ